MPVHTVTDPFLRDLGKVTINKDYLPYYRSLRSTVPHTSKISAPHGCLPASLSLYHGSNRTLVLPILFPQSISDSISANFIKESPVGSKVPITAFASTKEEQIPLSFIALADYLPSGYTSLKQYINDIKKMCIPVYSGNMVLSPWVVIQFSDLSFTAVCDSIGVEYDTSIYGNKQMAKATINCNFTVIQ